MKCRCLHCDGPVYVDEPGSKCPDCRGLVLGHENNKYSERFSHNNPGHKARMAAHQERVAREELLEMRAAAPNN